MLLEETEKFQPDQIEMLHDTLESSEHMVGLVNALLNISRLELGTFTILPEKHDLRELVESIIDEFDTTIKTKNLTIKELFPSVLAPVSIDEDLTRILFQNLISNAIKYTPKDGEIRVKLERRDTEVIFSVEDNGQGIPFADQPHIFEKMFRSRNAGDIQGNGLGLYMVKQIVEATGCRIWFESSENKGTSFHIAIPSHGMKRKEGTKKIRARKYEKASQTSVYAI